MRKAHYRRVLRFCAAFAALVVTLIIMLLVTQSVWAHRHEKYNETYMECRPVIGKITMRDCVIDENISSDISVKSADGFKTADKPLGNLQPGDILITLSTHTLGYRHGHAALVIDENTTLESSIMGTVSDFKKVNYWRNYADYAVLRVKGAEPGLRKAVAEYAGKNLYDVPYSLTAGVLGEKGADVDSKRFCVHCAYLVWYAWKEFGYDLDSDGGRLVTPADLLESELVEIIESRGFD